MNKFTCQHCGSDNTGYQKYVRCIIPVSLENGDIEYGQSSVDEEIYLAVSCGFVCMSCGRIVEHCGNTFQAENDFIDYLSLPEEQIVEEQRLYNIYLMESNQSDEKPDSIEDESYDGIES